MRRTGRIIIAGLVWVSALCFVTIVGLWARSYWVEDRFVWCDRHSTYYGIHAGLHRAMEDNYTSQIVSAHGGIMFQRRHEGYPTQASSLPFPTSRSFEWHRATASEYPRYERSSPSDAPNHHPFAAMGFEIVTPPRDSDEWPFYLERTRSLTLPFWAPALLTAIPCAGWLYGLRRRKLRLHRAQVGLCQNCAYDLRSSGDRCPECGMAAAPSAGPRS